MWIGSPLENWPKLLEGRATTSSSSPRLFHQALPACPVLLIFLGKLLQLQGNKTPSVRRCSPPQSVPCAAPSWILLPEVPTTRIHRRLLSVQANLEAAPRASNSYVLLGDTYRDLGQGTAAIQQYEQALELSPTSAEILDRLAMTERNGQPTQAIAHWRAAFAVLVKGNDYPTAKIILTHVNESGLEK